jgi:hypothetical protein
MAGFSMSDTEPQGSITRELINLKSKFFCLSV